MNCPKGGDVTNDCAGCVYSGDFHYDAKLDDCIKREPFPIVYDVSSYQKGYADALDHVAREFTKVFNLTTKP